MKSKQVKTMVECALMAALAFVLSCIKIIPMPLGGSATLVSMLPIMLISLRHGTPIGLATGFLYSLTQLAQAVIEGDVFIYCETAGIMIICVLFDYIFPFTALGIAGLVKDARLIKNNEMSSYLGLILAVTIRFVCHFATGVAIWGQWAPEGMGKFLYSFLYNGSYLGIDLLLCLAAAFFMLRNKKIKWLLSV